MTDTDTERDLAALSEDELAAELAEKGAAARRALNEAAELDAEIRLLLPELRKRNVKKWGPAKLEELISKVIERATISRLTSPVVGTSRKAASEGT